jgi:hypothetical protein
VHVRIAETDSFTAESVNYDDTPIAELELEGMAYRLDTGHGSAVAVSRREVGTWTWNPVAQGRWDGRHLRVKGLDDPVLSALAEVLSAATRARDE